MKDKTNIKRKLLTDRKLPDSEQIGQRKDFNSIKQNYSIIKSNFLKKILLGGGAIVGTAVIALVVYFNGAGTAVSTSEEKKQSAEAHKEACIAQPLPGKDVPFALYKVSVKNGGVIKHETGSTITIPSNAFLSGNNQAFSDSITIKYREFHNPYDIFLSGIPMKYDSAGTKYTFESAGMIEIQGYDGDQLLQLDAKKPIGIAMVSANNEKDFNLYYLDTVNKNWIYKGRDQIAAANGTQSVQKNNKAGNSVSKTPVNNEVELLKPQLADPDKYCFNIGYDKKEFPELEAYENVLFEVADNSFKPAFYKISWDKISLHSSNSKGVFVVKLKKADTTIAVNARPVFDKEDYNKALSEFEANHKKVVEKESAKDSKANARLNEVNKELSTYDHSDYIRAENYRVSRVFAIRSFGIYNSDKPIRPRAVEAEQIANAGRMDYSVIYVVEKEKNAVFTFSENETVLLNPNVENLIWTITDKRKIAFFRESDFLARKGVAKPIIAVNQELALKQIREFSN